jgi:hypothetical protein
LKWSSMNKEMRESSWFFRFEEKKDGPKKDRLPKIS